MKKVGSLTLGVVLAATMAAEPMSFDDDLKKLCHRYGVPGMAAALWLQIASLPWRMNPANGQKSAG